MNLLLRASAALITILCVGEVAALAVGRLTYRDPFAAYEALMPGQPIAQTSRAFDCNAQPGGDEPESVRCVVHFDDRTFVSATTIGNLDTFAQTWLHARNLRVGDVILHWGQPDSVTKYRSLVYIYWHEGLYATIYPVGQKARFTPQVPVTFLSISRGQPFPVPPSDQ